MDRGDEDEARNYHIDVWMAGKSLESQAIEFLRSKGLITYEELAAAQINPKRAARQPAAPAPPKKLTSVWAAAWLRRNALPQQPGYTIQQAANAHHREWTAKYPGAQPHASRSKTYHDTSSSSEAAARHCMGWLWRQQLLEHPDATCEWGVGTSGLPTASAAQAVR